MDEEPEETEGNGIIKHDNIKELVNKYVAAVKLFDEQLKTGVKMNNLISTFYHGKLCFDKSYSLTPL